ncbi:sortase domain-bontaining protein, partial [Bacillus cereus]
INKHWITDSEDRTVIVEKSEPTLTLTTCYPFDYIGDAPDRYIIESSLLSIR